MASTRYIVFLTFPEALSLHAALPSTNSNILLHYYNRLYQSHSFSFLSEMEVVDFDPLFIVGVNFFKCPLECWVFTLALECRTRQVGSRLCIV